MTPLNRPSRQQFNCRVRFAVPGQDGIAERFADNLSEGGMFIRDDAPPPVGSFILIEFVLPDGQPLSRVSARVVHARPATTTDDRTAGMGVKFVRLDAVATSIVDAMSQQIDRSPPSNPDLDDTESRLFNIAGLEAPLLTSGGPIVGIDLGTVNSCVAVVRDHKPHVVPSPQGYDAVPSVMFLSKDEKILVGHKALERMILEPHRAVYGAKRFLGRPFVSREVQTFGHFFNYDLVPLETGLTAARIGERILPLETVGGHILLKLKQMAELALSAPVARAVITVPAYFGETQREAVREAGRHAGLHVERILNEPTAAAVAYGYGRGMDKTVLVYDLGGGTFDVTVLKIKDDTFEVLATDGDPFLGGSDFDDRLTEYVLTSFERAGHSSLRGDPVAVQRVRFAVELAKRQLSEATTVDIDLPYVAQTDDGPVHLKMALDRALLERLTEDLVDRTMQLVQVVLDRAQISSAELGDVLLVGGQSRSPHVRQRLLERFDRRPTAAVHPTEAVATGAALVAEALHTNLAVHLADILPASIRLALPDGVTMPLLKRGARLPVETTFEVPPSSSKRPEIRILLYRGESQLVEENTFLGSILFPPAPSSAALTAKVKVLLKISGDGLLSVSAFHPVTGETKELDLVLTDA